MAKDKTVVNVMESLQQEPDTDERIGRFLSEQSAEFPDASTISVDFKYQNPFEVPNFLDQANYAYAWLDPNDDIQMYNALEQGYYKIVTRSSSCILNSRRADAFFRSHGAIELQRMILGFRPIEIENRIRQMPVIQHKAIVESLSEGSEKEGYSTTAAKYRGDHNEGAGAITQIVAHEEAGEEGIKEII